MTDIFTPPPSSCARDLAQREKDIDILARTIWGEARGEGTIGMQAVAAVILNRLRISRAHQSYWWGDTLIDICKKPWQFSVWNADDPNCQKIQKIDQRNSHFKAALHIASTAIKGNLSDPVSGATHYHAVGITPLWTHTEKPVAVIGHHIFYKLA